MVLNGVSLVYAMAFVNTGLALISDFGVRLSDTQRGAITAFVNAGLVLVSHIAYVRAKHSKEVIPAPPIDESKPR